MLDYYRFKEVYDLFVRNKCDEARDALSDLQQKYIELCDENELLKTQVQEFEEVLYLAKNLEYDGHSYWLKTGGVKQGPFCQNCFDRDGLLIRLNSAEATWKCNSCSATYLRQGDTLREAPVAAVSGRDRAPHAESGGAKVIQLYK